MRFKLDENFGPKAALFLKDAGHDVMTVREEQLGGADDAAVMKACVTEKRVLITLDHDFGNVIQFPSESCSGIVVIELPPGQSPGAIVKGLETMLEALKENRLDRTLWIVEPGRVRIHQREDLDI